MAAKEHGSDQSSPDRYRIPRESGWANAWKISLVVAALGVVVSFLGYQADPRRFAFSWLFAIVSVLAIGLGALFFVIVQHMAGAGWSVTLRRTAEFFALGLPVTALLMLPVLFVSRGHEQSMLDDLYPWMHEVHEAASGEHGEEHASGEALIGASTARAQHGGAEGEAAEHGAAAEGHGAHTPQHALHQATVTAKLAFLNPSGFRFRGVLYIAIWAGLAFFFFSRSTSQDSTRDLNTTKAMQSLAPVATMLFGLSLTFAAFDWMMSLEPAWYSTIFGVQYFAVSAVSSLATLVATVYALKSAGLLGEAVQTEHFHDIGKLLFGFMVFWAYITFSQFMLIWYAGIPEEATYYHARWSGGWQTFTLVLAATHFILPFFLLISRNAKRRVPFLAFMAGWLLVNHVLECYWLIMPYANDGDLAVSWMDGGALFAVAGVYLTFVFFNMTRYPLIPLGDPRLSRALHHEVV